MGFISGNGLAVCRLLSGRCGHFRKDGCLQLHARPDLSHTRHGGQFRSFWRRRCTRGRWSLRRAGQACLWSPRHLDFWHFWFRHFDFRHSGFGRRRKWRQSEPLALHLMALDHRLAQVFHFCRLNLPWCRNLRRTWLRASGSCGRHRDYGGFFLHVIQKNRLLRSRVGDDTGFRSIETKLPIAGPPHSRCGLGRWPPTGRLRLCRAVGAERRCCRSLAHRGDQFSTR